MKKIITAVILLISIVISASAMKIRDLLNPEFDEKNCVGPLMDGWVCYVGYEHALDMGDHNYALGFSNIIGYKSESFAKNKQYGCLAGVLCECRVGMLSNFYCFIIPEFAGENIWLDVVGAQDIKYANLKAVDACWNEFQSMPPDKKKECLFNIALKIFEIQYRLYNSYDILLVNWICHAINTLVSVSILNFSNAHKILLFLTKIRTEGLISRYGVGQAK